MASFFNSFLNQPRYYLILLVGVLACTQGDKKSNSGTSDIIAISAMRNVMWKGELDGAIKLDTLTKKEGLFGLGPLSYLTGEVLISDGKSFVSKVLTDSTMLVEENFSVSAPFFVYGYVHEWQESNLPVEISTLKNLEAYVDEQTESARRPFVFKLTGTVETAKIHVQNLPEGSKVTSPDEAHVGQVSYTLNNEEVEIVGFFSTEHKGVFTHHDSFVHTHLITTDLSKMGHLDEVVFEKVKLYLPK